MTLVDRVTKDLVALYIKILDYPKSLITVLVIASCLAGWQLKNFSFDASADTLVVQGDPKLEFYREMGQIFGGDEFLILTIRPKETPMFSRATFNLIDSLQTELTEIEGVTSVFSMLDAPLLQSPPVPLQSLNEGYLTLRDEKVDLALAPVELAGSPFFSDYLLSSDLSTTAMRIDLELDSELEQVRRQRDGLALKSELSGDEQQKLASFRAAHSVKRKQYLADRQSVIDQIRVLKEKYSPNALIYLGGVPMIAADMITFVKNDIVVFGIVVALLMMLLLYLFFRHIHWVLLPMLISGVSVLMVTGLLGFIAKPVTAISSSYVLLLTIICISFSVHLIVRYRELFSLKAGADYRQLVNETMTSKFSPCVYTALTTMVAFSAMMTSKILPVEDFGLIMCIGVAVSLFITYLMFPALLLIIGERETTGQLDATHGFTRLLSTLSREYPWSVLSGGMVLFIVACIGLTQLSFNNRFVEYFSKSTEIRKGMEYIDDHLGGTVPFEVYLQYESWEAEEEEDDFFDEEEDSFPQRYWVTPDKIADVDKLQQFINDQAPTGKVLSIATLEKIARTYTDGKPLNALQIVGVLDVIPDAFKGELIDSFANPESGYMKINALVKESGPYFSRSQLSDAIVEYANKNIVGADVKVSGMMVLFDDMLSQLFSSQINTLAFVVAATFIMFSLLLRSFTLAVLALIPNIITAATIIAIMGYANVPMDMMTITIAAIVIGIGVDNAIHYLHRFGKEQANDRDLKESISQAHATVGRAMYYTSLIVVGGFSILTLSNFQPTVYFGMLTAIAMLLAMFTNLTILPSLLLKVWGRGKVGIQIKVQG